MAIPATITVLGHTVKTKYVAGAAAVALGYYLFFTPSGKALFNRTGLTGHGHSANGSIGAAALPASGY
jgi:hypothetical protein